MLFLSIVPIYLMLTVSFKNPLQYQHERWNVSLPLRVRNYVAVWDMIGDYFMNTAFVAVNSESLRVLSVGLYLLRADTLGAGWGPLFAGYTIASIPLAVLFSPWASFTWKGWLNQA